MTRREEIAAGLAHTRERIAAACDAAGRAPDEVTLIVVTKFFPVDDVLVLLDLGERNFGESRHQEASAKVAELARLEPEHPGRWHFIGNLQSNKAAAVAGYADVVHSVDRAKLIAPLSRGRAETAALSRDPLQVLLQVDLDPAPVSASDRSRGGADPASIPALADSVIAAEQLELRGVMGVAPLDEDPDQAFEQLARVSAQVKGRYPDATWVSSGMSGDLEAAIRHGATHARVGSAILGSRVVGR